MFYFSIAVGGALGSMARAWLALAVARITGPAFPWGTILINIIGSFVIGFFGSLTANESRLAVPADLRAFVMIGICGGFTTFSSFSLQTLDLMRDGRMLQASGNVVGSVLCCLVAVSAGHYAAAGLQAQPGGAASAYPTGLGQRIIAILGAPDSAAQVLDGAARLLPKEGGQILALRIRLAPPARLLPSAAVDIADHELALRAPWENWAERLRGVTAERAAARQPLGIETVFQEAEGDAGRVFAERARGAGAIVVARPDGPGTTRLHEDLHAALFATGAPVLILPPGAGSVFGATVAIAWRDDPHAVGAVLSAGPLLAGARLIHVLSAGGAQTPPPLPGGVAVAFHQIEGGPGPAGARLLAAARGLGADLLVMGAFTHGAWRERLFGGVTRTVLAESTIPVLMRHMC